MRWSQVWLCLNKLCAATVTPKLDRLPDKPSDKDKGELLSVTLHEISYLRNIWSKCLANEAKSNDKDMTRPPTTAVKRALFRRHSATKKGAKRCETAKLVEPIQTAKKQFKFYVSYVNNSKTCLFESWNLSFLGMSSLPVSTKSTGYVSYQDASCLVVGQMRQSGQLGQWMASQTVKKEVKLKSFFMAPGPE